MPSLLLYSSSNSSSDDENMLEHSSDHDNQNEQKNVLTRQFIASTKKNSKNGSKFPKSNNHGEATLLETERDETNSNQQQIFSGNTIDKKQQPDDIHIFSPDELDTNAIPKLNNTQPSSSTLPKNVEKQRPITKIPIRSNSSTRSPAPTRNKRQISSSATNKGAFHYFTTDDKRTLKVPKIHISSADNTTPSLKDDRKRITSSDDDDVETNNLKENDLKLKLKEHKRHGKKTGELLNKLHENYEELLEKYAHAENTIDQLRFQPKISGDNTPRSNASEHFIHITQQPKVNIAALRLSGAYHSTTNSPFSSIRPVPSTTTTTPARKSISSANSGTNESIYFDESIPEKNIVQETLKLDLLIETKSLEDKMKSFLTLMDEDQLSLPEQKQVYETIRQDYEKLIRVFDHNKCDLDTDLNNELDIMKQLLKEIVKKITHNLLGKSATNSSPDRQTNDESHSSQLSIRSPLCNHNDLMDQYQNLLNTVNTTKRDPMKSVLNELEKPINNKQNAYVYVSEESDDEQQPQSNGIKPIPYTKGIEKTSLEPDYIPSTSVKYQQHKIEERKRKRKKKIIPNDSNSLTRTNGTRYSDSGIGTNNLTKMSYDSKLYTNTMDESHFQSLDEEQESISSSSRSSGSGFVSPGSPYSKKFDNRSSYRRKPSGHSDSYQSDIETHITGSFDILPQKNMHRTYHTWKPQKSSSISRHSRLTPIHRSVSTRNPPIEDYKIKSHRPLTTPHISSKINTNQGRKISPTYRSSIYINQTHTHKGLQDKINRNLYLDSQTGVIYRCESNRAPNLSRICYQPSSQKKLYRCDECGIVTTYEHRHHIDSPSRLDDLGYESSYKKKHRRYRDIDYLSSSSSSNSDSDSSNYHEMISLNQAYNRAEKIQDRSRYLSRYVIQQLKLALATL